LDESIGREGVLGDRQAVICKGGEVELDSFVGHLLGVLIVAAPGDAALEGRDCDGESPFGLRGKVYAVGEGLHCP
jgi:hypothetical protein